MGKSEVDAVVTTRRIFQGLLSGILTAALFLFSTLPAQAAELPEETVQETESVETTALAEVTEPVQTVPETEPPETIPPTEPPTVPEETEPAETTQCATEPEKTAAAEPEPQAQSILTIAQAWAMPAGTENIVTQGTVVFASGAQAVLQDGTGGIRLSFDADPGTVPGEVLRVTGRRGGGMFVSDFESLGTADLPVVETTLLEAPENLRVCVRSASLGYSTLSQNGFSMPLIADLAESVEGSVDVCGVILDGCFYADSVAPAAVSEISQEPSSVWNAYFGQLHAYSSLSEGLYSVEEVFESAAAGDLDFFAVSDHSDSFDNALFGSAAINGSSVSTEWARGKAAAKAVTDGSFVGIFGYEMSWPEDYALGHVSTFNTPGWQAWTQEGFDTLERYCEVLAAIPGSVSQFNHPGHVYGSFHRFSEYSPAMDAVIQLLEVGTRETADPYEYYNMALDRGWHVAPTSGQATDGLWDGGDPARTVVLARELTEESLYEAMSSRRVYATQDGDLTIRYWLNGHMMGSISGPADSLTASVYLSDPTDAAIGAVEVIADGGVVVKALDVPGAVGELEFDLPAGYGYYYLRITQPDGDTAVTAPVWVDSFEDMGIGGFVSNEEQPVEGQEVRLTLELFNQENTGFLLEKLAFYQQDTLIHEVTDPGTVNALSTISYSFPYSRTEPGTVWLRAVVTGTVMGQSRSYEQTLTLRYQAKQIAASTIAETRVGIPGTAYRVKGYVTAGNSNPYTTFSDTIYLQDDTGGIAVTGVTTPDIEVGRPMEVTGILRKQAGNLVLEMTDLVLPDETYYRFLPRAMTNGVAMDYETHGGELLQVEGTVVSLLKTADGAGISRLTIRNVRGGLATVVIGDDIVSGAQGKNELAAKIKKGRTVRAIGLLHVDEFEETVLRVRNCDEVVYVPPTADPTNPKTGDAFGMLKFFFGR